VEDFLENEMDTTAPLDYDFPSTLDTKTGDILDPNRSSMEWFKIRWVMFFDKFYSNAAPKT
jgi:hypothetical protein